MSVHVLEPVIGSVVASTSTHIAGNPGPTVWKVATYATTPGRLKMVGSRIPIRTNS